MDASFHHYRTVQIERHQWRVAYEPIEILLRGCAVDRCTLKSSALKRGIGSLSTFVDSDDLMKSLS